MKIELTSQEVLVVDMALCILEHFTAQKSHATEEGLHSIKGKMRVAKKAESGKGEKTFKLYWLDGKEEEVIGWSISDAFERAGYGAGAAFALDWYKEV